MNQKIKRDCPTCGRTYDADPARLKHGRHTTCGRACSYKARAANLERREQYKCGACDKVITRAPSQVKSRHGVLFCSKGCAYAKRIRVVSRPYVLVSEYDRSTAGKKAWETRRRNPKPYPDAARQKAATSAIQRIKNGGGVSCFEREAAKVFRAIGFTIDTSVAIRRTDGTFRCVFDIVIPSRQVVVECHGTYFHGGRWTWDDPTTTQVKNLTYEARKLVDVRRIGFDLRILWEHEFKKDPCGACLSVVR